jgi:hypothetical protein
LPVKAQTVVAVSGDGASVRSSCLVTLEPGDVGLFERGPQVRKLGHRLASTTNPNFDLRVPASRIVGGCTVEDGVVIPRFDHRPLLEPALRRTRALLSLMTASKALSMVEAFLNIPINSGAPGPDFRTWESTNPNQPVPMNFISSSLQPWLNLAELWASGEAATSLGFSAVRGCDEFDRSGEQTRSAALLPAAAKLYGSSRLPALLRQAAASEDSGSPAGSALREKIIVARRSCGAGSAGESCEPTEHWQPCSGSAALALDSGATSPANRRTRRAALFGRSPRRELCNGRRALRSAGDAGVDRGRAGAKEF